jgi:hypothetical protein
MTEKEMIVFETDLNKIPKEEALAIVPIKKEALALVPIKEEARAFTPVPDAKPFTVVPPKALATVLPTRSYEQAYYVQVRRPTLPSPPMKLFLKDAPKDKRVAVPQGTKVLPPKDNERVINVKTNKFGDVTCVKYATTSRVSLDRIRAPPGEVQFLLTRETPKRYAPPPLFEREARHPKTTIAILEERFEAMKQQMAAMQANRDLQHTTMKNMMTQ